MKTTSHIQTTAAQTADKTKSSFVQRHLGHLGHLGLTMPGVLTLLAILSAGTASAQLIWDGSTDNTWNDGTNWDTNTAPVANDRLVFNDLAPTPGATLNNDTTADTVYTLEFGTGFGYNLTGNRITLGATATGSNDLLSNTAGDNTISLDVINGTNSDYRVNNGTLTMAGIVSGGNITNRGNGTLIFTNADNSFGALAHVSTGNVQFDTGAFGTTYMRLGWNTTTNGIEYIGTGETINNQIYIGRNNGNTNATYTGGSIISNTGSGTLTFSNAEFNPTLNEASTRNIEFNGTSDIEVQGVIRNNDGVNGAGIVSLTKDGSNTLTLSGANTYTGDTNIDNGTLEFQNSEALGTGLVRMSGGGVLQFGANGLDLSENVRSQNAGDNRTIRLDLAGTNTGTLSGELDIRNTGAGNFSIDVGTDDTLSVTSVAIGSGSAGLTKTGEGQLSMLFNNASYTGITRVDRGTLELTNNGVKNTNTSSSGFEINNGSTLRIVRAEDVVEDVNGILIAGKTFTFDSNGGGALEVNGSSVVLWRDNTIVTTGGSQNTFSGTAGVNIQNNLNNASTEARQMTFNVADGSDEVDLLVSTDFSNAKLIKDGAGTVALTSSGNAMTVASQTVTINDGTLEIGGAGRLNSGNYSKAITNNGTFKYNSTNDQTLSGVISGNGAVVKDNSSTLTLSGDNTYSGTTTVSGGTLALATGYTHSGGGAFTVEGGILKVADGVNIGSAMTIGLGGVISPGNSPGTANTGAQTWNDGGSYLWEINASDDAGGTIGTDPGWDWLSITGALDLTNLSAGGFTIDIDSLTASNLAGDAVGFDTWTKGNPGDVDYSFIIASASGGITDFSADKFSFDSSGFTNGPSWDWQIKLSGTDLVLEAYAVPEPSSAALLGLGGLALLLRRKRS